MSMRYTDLRCSEPEAQCSPPARPLPRHAVVSDAPTYAEAKSPAPGDSLSMRGARQKLLPHMTRLYLDVCLSSSDFIHSALLPSSSFISVCLSQACFWMPGQLVSPPSSSHLLSLLPLPRP